MDSLQSYYEAQLGTTSWVEPEVPSWDGIIASIEEVLNQVANQGKVESEGRARPFRNFITDRDGTINNVCDRYASSIQSAYNGAWLSHFARHCTENALIITSAPLGGRPSAEGLMELCVVPRGIFTFTGSKGREYFNNATQRLLEVEELPQKQRELRDELQRHLQALCSHPDNTKFLGIGSGLQRKFGEITIARNDRAGTVPEPESRRFMAAVREVKQVVDPDGSELDLHDTGCDMEFYPRAWGGQSFDKGSGLLCLDKKLQLRVADGPNLICGDAESDISMIVAALRLMCGDRMVDIWQERILREEDPEQTLDDEDVERIEEEPVEQLSEQDLEQQRREEAERKADEEEAERVARQAAARLAVLFVVEKKTRINYAAATEPSAEPLMQVVDRVKAWCKLSGAQCVLVPSSDALVASLASYANRVAGKSVVRRSQLSELPETGLRRCKSSMSG